MLWVCSWTKKDPVQAGWDKQLGSPREPHRGSWEAHSCFPCLLRPPSQTLLEQKAPNSVWTLLLPRPRLTGINSPYVSNGFQMHKSTKEKGECFLPARQKRMSMGENPGRHLGWRPEAVRGQGSTMIPAFLNHLHTWVGGMNSSENQHISFKMYLSLFLFYYKHFQ